MQEDYPLYPIRHQVTTYINRYADYFNLRKHIRFYSEIKSITPLDETGEKGWRVELEDGHSRNYRGV